MKYFVIGILVFVTSYCFAINQKLIDGVSQYGAAVVNLNKINSDRAAADMSIGNWIKEFDKAKDSSLSDDDRKLAQNKIDEEDRRWHALDDQLAIAKEAVKKYEPMKKEYDKQKKIESERNQFWITTLSTVGVFSIFVAIFCWIISQHRKYRRLIKEGKMTQQEYDFMMKNNSPFSSTRTNPATGLAMIGSVDAGGNPAGCSFRSNSTFNEAQDYSDRHRWDR